jgi:FixJ family two-component response regulator
MVARDQDVRRMPRGSIVHVIDDDHGFRKGLERLLKANGLKVRTFESAEEFEAHADLAEAGCLILDIHLGGMSGIELRCKLTQTGAQVPVVFVTASDNEATRKAAINAGCLACLEKPFPANVLLDVVGGALAH